MFGKIRLKERTHRDYWRVESFKKISFLGRPRGIGWRGRWEGRSGGEYM